MAWGGGGFGHVGGGHGGLGHHPGGHRPGQPVAGLPFAGIPQEMVAGVRDLLAGEPEHPEPVVEFSHRPPAGRRRFTLGALLRPHWAAMAVAVGLVVLETVSLQVGPQLTQRAIDHGMLAGDFGVVALMAGLYLGSVVVNGVVGAVRVAWTGRLGQRLMHGVRVRVFSHLQRLSLDFFTEEKTGRIMTRMTSDIEALSDLLQDGLVNMAVQGLTLTYVVLVLFSMDRTLALVVCLAVVPVMTVLTLWFRRESQRAYNRVRETIADAMADLQEGLAGIRIVTVYNRQRYNEVKHRNIVGDHRRANDRAAKVAAVFGPGSDGIGTLGTAVIVLVGGHRVVRGHMLPGELVAFVLYLNAFFAPIQHLVQLYNTYQSGQAAAAKLRDLLDTEPSVAERPAAVDLPPVRGEIVFDGVSFEYLPGQPVLRDVSLTVAAGETFSLVGTTGSGKSTLARLVTRLYDPTGGRVLVDGHDVRDVTLASLRRQIGVVPQEPFLFAGTIRDNVTFGRPEATEAEVLEACRVVGLGPLVERLPAGLDTPVHERGSSLSSGERQLLALARVFLTSPRVLILDEATSSLDLRSEATIETALDQVVEGRTAIIIAHRLSTALRADRIGVVEGGRLVEVGSHDELVALGGAYAALYARWLSHAPG